MPHWNKDVICYIMKSHVIYGYAVINMESQGQGVKDKASRSLEQYALFSCFDSGM